jgi:hypothetical protein
MYELEYGLWLSGLCLRQLMIDHVSVRFTWMFCSICMPPTWLVINTSPTNRMAGGASPVGGLLDLMQHAKAAH